MLNCLAAVSEKDLELDLEGTLTVWILIFDQVLYEFDFKKIWVYIKQSSPVQSRGYQVLAFLKLKLLYHFTVRTSPSMKVFKSWFLSHFLRRKGITCLILIF